MESERRIGRVIVVDSERIIVELDDDSKSLTKTFLTGNYPIACINSYVVIPIGSVSVVGIVTRVSMRGQDVELRDRSSLMLAHPRRTMDVTMVGTLTKTAGGLGFQFGIKDFPTLDNPVWFILEEELDTIFDKKQSKENQRYFVELGASATYPEYKVKLNPDILFSRHLAVLGNTGAGKSCTIASLIQTILRDEHVRKGAGAHFVIFDTNGEYKDAFSASQENSGTKEFMTLHIDQTTLRIPYWFMNFQDWKNLLQPKEGSQIPVLSKGLLYARNPELKPAVLGVPQLEVLLDDAKNFFGNLRNKYPNKNPEEQYTYVCNDKDRKANWEKIIKGIVTGQQRPEEQNPVDLRDVDMPSHFDRDYFRSSAIGNAIEESGPNASQIRSYCETMLQRMDRFFSDPRYDFLFHNFPVAFPNSLAAFLRLCFGRMANAHIDESEADNDADEEYFLARYLATQSGDPKSNYAVVIFDLSLVPYDVLENVTALLGRLMLEFMQRIEKVEKYEGEEARGKFPVVLVLEEAHNYIPEYLPKDKESVSREVFQRIAREGRKYGLSLVVSSQRPSELSRTVLSQCNSYITHRIQNPEDQKYVQSLLPTVSHDLLKQLPILRQGVALVFGDCVRAPMEVVVKKPDPEPKSHDPQFWKHWTDSYDSDEFSFENGEPDFEAVCAVWEGAQQVNPEGEKQKLSEKSVYHGNQLGDKRGKPDEGVGDTRD